MDPITTAPYSIIDLKNTQYKDFIVYVRGINLHYIHHYMDNADMTYIH